MDTENGPLIAYRWFMMILPTKNGDFMLIYLNKMVMVLYFPAKNCDFP